MKHGSSLGSLNERIDQVIKYLLFQNQSSTPNPKNFLWPRNLVIFSSSVPTHGSFKLGNTDQGFCLALTLGAGYLDVGEGGCFEFEFLTEGPWHERKAANNCCGLYGRKADSKLFRADRKTT